jgi:beta-glucosidase
MIRKVIGLVLALSVGLMALPVLTSTVDNVKVPAFLIKGSGLTWSGKVTYMLVTGDNDSVNISLAINPAPATPNAPACNVTKTEGDVGMFPMINGMNGKREIFFECSFATAPAATDQYVAVVNYTADMSGNETLARNVLAQIPNNTQKSIILCGGTGEAPQHDGFCTGDITAGTYGTITGLACCDGPHGINGWGWAPATMFPCNSAVANAFDTSLCSRIGTAIGEEATVLWQGRYVSLGPMLNMVRDPRGARDYETFGEDPYLMGKLASAHIRGIQSTKCVAEAKHFLCNDQDRDRTTASMNVDAVTLRQSYAYPFEMTVREGKTWAVMAAYNQVNGVKCTENKFLLTDILRTEWGFRGFTTSDWSTAMTVDGAMNAGLNVQMPENDQYSQLPSKVSAGQLTQDHLDRMVLEILRAKAWAGDMTGWPAAYNGLTMQQMHDGSGNVNHQRLADSAAREVMVLLKNDVITGTGKPLLPIDSTKSVIIVGPYADKLRVGGNGQYTSSKVLPFPSQNINTPLQSITRRLGATHIAASQAAADYIIVVVGIASDEGTASASFEGQDRPDASLSTSDDGVDQNALVQGIYNNYPNKTIVVFTGGAAVTNGAWYTPHAIVYAGYAGEKQGPALADILLGTTNPSGKITFSFPVNQNDLPTFTNGTGLFQYEGPSEGRGYPYYLWAHKTPLIPFGFGLSYTTYSYSNLQVPARAVIGDRIKVSVDITNTGSVDGVEIPQLYISQVSPVAARPVKQLRGFARVSIPAGQTRTATFDLKEWDFAHWTLANGWIVDPSSTFKVVVGKNSMDSTSLQPATIIMDPGE